MSMCASIPGGDPNRVTDDLGAHLNMEHRNTREHDEPLGRNIRSIFHPLRGGGPPRIRRGNPFTSAVTNRTAASATISSARDSIDPIAELLSQLSGVRRAAQQQSAAATASQLQLLQQQLQFERQQVQQARDRLERLPVRKQAAVSNGANNVTSKEPNSNSTKEQFLLPRYYEESRTKSETEKEKEERKEREQFCSELFFSFISPELESTLPGNEVANTLSSESESSVRMAESAERTTMLPQSDSSQIPPVDGVGGETLSAQAASSSASNIVVSKGLSGCESDCVYSSDSEMRSARP